jgi:hypothetical protein
MGMCFAGDRAGGGKGGGVGGGLRGKCWSAWGRD